MRTRSVTAGVATPGQVQSMENALNNLFKLIDGGHYREALLKLDATGYTTAEHQVLKHLVELETGDPALAGLRALELSRGRLCTREKVLCLFILGRSECIVGRVDEGCQKLRQAVALAKTTNNPTLTARAQSRLTNALLRWVGIEAATPELPELHRVAFVAGDARSLTDFHCYLAEIEMKRGKYVPAAKQLNVAAGFCERQSDVVVSAQLDRLRANLATLSSRPHDALSHIKRAVQTLEQSGSGYSLLASLSTYAHLCVMLHVFDEAEAAILRILNRSVPERHRLAALDELMQVALARRDVNAARAHAEAIASLYATIGACYDWLWHIPTRAKWKIFENKPAEALSLLSRHFVDAAHTGDHRLISSFGFAEAEALAAMGQSLNAALCLGTTVSRLPALTLEDAVELNRIAATLVLEPAASSFGTRATRINDIAFSTRTRKYPEFVNAATSATPATVMQALASLFTIPVRSEVLAFEVAELLLSSGVATTAWVEDANDPMGFSELPHRHGTYEITLDDPSNAAHRVKVTLRPDPEAQLAFIALQHLTRSAITMGTLRERDYDEPLFRLDNHAGFDGPIVVSAPRMLEVTNIIRRVASSNVTVLFTGETGTGKEVLARLLHTASGRSEKPFIPFNCTAVSRDMLDSQLFGYRRGAFTGAQEAFQGIIRAAAGGTLLLDEIGEIAPEIQPKLLRFLESGEVHPLGESRPVPVDVRIVAATNANLEQLVEAGKFREDLFYRL